MVDTEKNWPGWHRWPGWRRDFLEALANCGSVAHAATSAGVTRQAAYKTREGDPEFADAWRDALDQALGSLERSMLERARDGTDSVILHDGEVVKDDAGKPIMRRTYETVLTIFAAKRLGARLYGDDAGETLALGALNTIADLDAAHRRVTEAYDEGRIAGPRFDRLLAAIAERRQILTAGELRNEVEELRAAVAAARGGVAV